MGGKNDNSIGLIDLLIVHVVVKSGKGSNAEVAEGLRTQRTELLAGKFGRFNRAWPSWPRLRRGPWRAMLAELNMGAALRPQLLGGLCVYSFS
jgi:hypothetical protein